MPSKAKVGSLTTKARAMPWLCSWVIEGAGVGVGFGVAEGVVGPGCGVTGGAGGIGYGLCSRFAREGAKVVVSDASGKRATSVAESITATGADAMGIECDVSNRQHVDSMVKQTLERWGRIDVLVNNAGRQTVCLIKDMTDEIFDQAIDINLKGTFYCSRAVLSTMIEQRHGSIVNFSSIDVQGSHKGDTHYAAAKAGVEAFTRGLAKEVGKHGIRVNCVCPGSIPNEFLIRSMARVGYAENVIDEVTKRIPLGRSGTPQEVAALVLFLASDEASYITGDTVNVSGGLFDPV